jgi:RHS repeat-associated protein
MNTMNRHSLFILLGIILFGTLQMRAIQKKEKVSFTGFTVTTYTDHLYVRADGLPQLCSDPQAAGRIRKATLYAMLDWKSDDLANNGPTKYKVSLTIRGYDDFGTSTLLATYTPSLTVTSNNPQSYVAIDFTGLHAAIDHFTVEATYSLAVGPSNATVDPVIETDVYFTEEFEYTVPVIGSPALYADQLVFNGNEATFKWGLYCPTPPPNYQFQLLRLYNNNIATSSLETSITAKIDWDKALTIETGNSLREISLTLAEGTGYYIWRVRPIGNAYEGGAGNDLNLGVWSATGSYLPGSTYSITSGTSPYLFFYNQFDDGMNWIFSRSFMEGDAQTNGQVVISEAMNYANGLQMALQQQTRLKAEKKKLVGQTVYDYSGRAALTSMAAPVSDNTLGYISSYVKNTLGNTYSAADFDADSNYGDPQPFDKDTPGPGKYYSNNNDLESDVPTADGYAYSRTLYMTDGTSQPKEQSSPGPDHRINHNVGVTRRTIRNMSTAVSDVELVRMFGDEAPAANSVMKNITTDANNGSSVTYVSKEGQTIMTCLSGTPAPNLDPLPAGTPVTAVFEVNNNTPYGSTGLSAFTTIGLSEQADVTITYSITPNVYEDACVEFCATCDYKVTINVIDNDDPTGPASGPVYTHTINPTSGTGGCSSSATTYTTMITLPAGSYTIERIIEAYQTDPLSSPPTSYIDGFVDQVEDAMHADFNTGTAVIVDDFGVPVPGAPSVNMATLRGFLPSLPATPDLDGLYAYLAVGPDQDHVNLQIGCHTIVFPILRCSSDQCPVDNDFEKYFTDWYSAHYGSTTTINTLMPQYSAGEFNTVIANMISCGGYDCQALYSCWRSIVSSYETISTSLSGLDLSASYNGYSMPPGTTFTANYLDMFLDCAGYKLVGINNNPGGSGCSNPGYKFHPYAYFSYNSANRCDNCEGAFYLQAPTTPPNPLTAPTHNSGSSPYAWANDADFTLDFNASGANYEQVKMFFDCIQLCNPVPGSSTPAFTDFADDVIADAMETCESRYEGFVTQLMDEYHRNNVHVEGDQYQLQFYAPYNYYIFNGTPYTYNPATDIPLSTIYCEAQALVEACKAQCVLTVTTTSGQTEVGTPAEIEAMGNALYGTYDLEIPSGGLCPSGYSSTASGLPATGFLQYAVNVMNNKLNDLRAAAPLNGLYWDFKTFAASDVDPGFATSKCDFGDYVFIHPDIPSYFDYEISPDGRCYSLVYYFNKQNANGGPLITPKRLYSTSLITAASPYPSEGFNYVCTFTITPAAGITEEITNGDLSYIVNSGFLPLTTSVPGTSPMDLTSQYTAGIITDDDLLNGYKLSSCEGQAYYKVTLCSQVCTTSVSCPSICYKIGPARTMQVNSPEFEGQGILFTAISCEQAVAAQMLNSLDQQAGQFVDEELARIRNEYRQKCINELVDQTKVSFQLNYHHYTLYYYDRAGNLVKTVPPKGVEMIQGPVPTSRLMHPDYTFITEYAYNSLHQLVRQRMPDHEGDTKFWYNGLGQLRFSQNAKQAAVIPAKMSFTKYDNLGRITASGEIPALTGTTLNTNMNTQSYPTTGTSSPQCTDLTFITYSDPPLTAVNYFGAQPQRYLQNRVSYGYSDKDGLDATTSDRVFTYYSYDPHGNVEWLIQDIPEIGKNYIGYEYDLISGSVLKVKYNEEFPDRFFHRYIYDESKRLKTVETSKDEVIWEQDARYTYNLHGSLKRAEIGHDKIQGLDYTYTIMGWLKGLNHVENAYDPGKDGNEAGSNAYTAKDAYSMQLGYYKGDYISKSSRLNSETGNPYYLAANASRDLFNGNISTWSSNYDYSSIPGTALAAIQHNNTVNGKVFNYDELNRITKSDYKTQDPVTKLWSASADYSEVFSYDANGNFDHLTRKGYAANSGGLNMDDFDYKYVDPVHMNRLSYVDEPGTISSTAYTTDLDDQSTGNYAYDKIGNLTSDFTGGISSIAWTVQGKVSRVTKSDNTLIDFLYDMMGHRVYKKVYKAADPVTNHLTYYYVPDASGNSMAVYTRSNSTTPTPPMPYTHNARFDLTEQPIYGSDRIGERSLNGGDIRREVYFSASLPPAPQNLPTPVHISAWPKLLIPLGNSTTTRVYNKPMDLNSGTNTTADLYPDFNITSSTLTPLHGRNQAVLYNTTGNILLSAYTYSNSTPAEVPRIYVGNAIVANSNLINTSVSGSQSVFIKRPGSNDEYYYVTIDASKNAYYHTVDASAANMLNYNNPIDNTLSFGQSMAVIDDRTGTPVLYMISYSGTTATIRTYAVTHEGFVATGTAYTFNSVNSSAVGDMQISANGTKLAIANTVSGTTGEIRVWNLGADHLISGPAGAISLGTNNNAKSVEFTQNDSYIYFTQLVGTTLNIHRQLVGTYSLPATPTYTIGGTSTPGMIRRGSSGNLYFVTKTTAAPTTSLIYMISAPENPALSSPWGVSSNSITSTATNGSLPVKPHVIDYQSDIIPPKYDRTLVKKLYELKDHLGNVHATISDYKVRTATDPNLKVNKQFNDGTVQGFTTVGTTTLTTVSNQLSITGALGSGATITFTTGTLPVGQYVMSFDYNSGNTPLASYKLVQGTALQLKGYLSSSGRQSVAFNVPAAASTVLTFTNEDAASHTFYIGDVLIKAVGSTMTDPINVMSETFSSPVTWNHPNATVTYPSGVMDVVTSTTPPPPVTSLSANKDLSLIPGLVYKINFDVNVLNTSGGTLYFEYRDNDNQQADHSYFVRSTTGSGSYTYYFVPRTAQGNLSFAATGTNLSTFHMTIDNVIVTQYENKSQPMYTAQLMSLTDYYAFGAPMPGRNYVAANSYRYGFNGQEKDNEVYGEGNEYDFGARVYDPRVSRFFSIDPYTNVFPYNTPYSFAINCPTLFVDEEGGKPRKPRWISHPIILLFDSKEVKLAKKFALATNSLFMKIPKASRDEYGYSAAVDLMLYRDYDFGLFTTETEDNLVAQNIMFNIISELEYTYDLDLSLDPKSPEFQEVYDEIRMFYFDEDSQYEDYFYLPTVLEAQSPIAIPISIPTTVVLPQHRVVASGSTHLNVEAISTNKAYDFASKKGKIKAKSARQRKRESGEAEHTKNKRKSTKGKHQKGQSRKKRDKQGERKDDKMPYRMK